MPKQTGDICYRLWDPELYGETNILVEKRWYFDEQTQRCMVFDYGGCLGNANNYLSQSDCQLQNNCECNQSYRTLLDNSTAQKIEREKERE